MTMYVKKRISGSWVDAPCYIYKTDTDTFTTFPVNIITDGTPLTAWSISGNMVQDGTPTPDAPIQPQEFGDKTANLCDLQFINASLSEARKISSSSIGKVYFVRCEPNTVYTLSGVMAEGSDIFRVGLSTFETIAVGQAYVRITNTVPESGSFTFTTDADTKTIVFHTGLLPGTIMLNAGSTALPYEPFGYAVPITCAGQTTPIYLGQTPTVRRIRKLVLTGDEPTWAQFENDKSRVTINGYLRQLGVVIGVSSHFVSKPSSASMSGYLSDGEFSFLVSSSGNNYVYFYNGDTPYVADFKQWLADQYAAGTPVCIWYILAEPETGIVNEPLRRIGDYSDEVRSSDAGVAIPTAAGENTLTVDTALQPSEMTITYRGWHPSVARKRINGAWD